MRQDGGANFSVQPSPRCNDTDFVCVWWSFASKHLSRPVPDCLKPPQMDVIYLAAAEQHIIMMFRFESGHGDP